jgi:hypothetical protein
MPPTLSLRRIAPCPNNFIQRPGSLSSDARCVCLSNIGSDTIDSPGDMIPGLRARAAVQSSSRARRLGAPRGAVDQFVASFSSRCVMPNCRRRLDCARVGTLFPDVLPKNGTAAALPSFRIDRSVHRRARVLLLLRPLVGCASGSARPLRWMLSAPRGGKDGQLTSHRSRKCGSPIDRARNSPRELCRVGSDKRPPAAATPIPFGDHRIGVWGAGRDGYRARRCSLARASATVLGHAPDP